MNFLINVNFKDTHSLRLVLVDPDPADEASVFSAVFDSDTDEELLVFFEAPHGAEVWEILAICLNAYKDFKSTEEVK